MKKILVFITAMLFVCLVSAQTRNSTGMYIGPKTDVTVRLISKAIKPAGAATNKLALYSGSTVLSVINPDSTDFRTIGILKADSNKIITGGYITPYFNKVTPSIDNYLKGLKKGGSDLKGTNYLPFPLSGTYTALDGKCYLNRFYQADTITITGFRYSMNTPFSGTADNYNGFFLARISNDSIIIIASTPNDAAIFTTSSGTIATKALTTPVTIAPGIYYTGVISNWSAVSTSPIWYVASPGPLLMLGHGLPNGFRIGAYIDAATVPTAIKTNTLNHLAYILPLEFY